jgi:hypothetical protein
MKKKTKIMTSDKIAKTFSITINNRELEKVQSFDYPGPPMGITMKKLDGGWPSHQRN